jgi:hypothetical protein
MQLGLAPLSRRKEEDNTYSSLNAGIGAIA